MRAVKVVIAERHRAWTAALDLWTLHTDHGLDLSDRAAAEAVHKERCRQTAFRELYRRKGRALANILRPLKRRMQRRGELPTDGEPSADERMRPFHVVPTDGRYAENRFDLDWTPVANRRHRSRRRVNKLHLARHKLAFPVRGA